MVMLLLRISPPGSSMFSRLRASCTSATVTPRAAMSDGRSRTYITWVRSPESDTSLTPSTRLKGSTSTRLA